MKYLIVNRMKDAEILWKNNRFAPSFYIAGYAVEIALKYKVCKAFHFSNGFPETRWELSNYLDDINKNNLQQLTINLRDVRTHDLNKLLFYSGMGLKIKKDLLSEWTIVSKWRPENRYKKLIIFNKKVEIFLKAVKKIIKEIN